VADALPPVEVLSATLDYTALATSQQADEKKLKNFLRSNTGL